MEGLDPSARPDEFGSKINRTQSRTLAFGIPLASIMLGSLTAMLPIISPAPILPPIAFMLLLAWRMLRPGLLPLWAGMPLGLFDDLYSGQPLGSAILFFSLALFAIEYLEYRFPWRSFVFDWFMASMFLIYYLFFATLVSGASINLSAVSVILPQLLLSIALFPIIARMVALLDRLRLMRIRRLA